LAQDLQKVQVTIEEWSPWTGGQKEKKGDRVLAREKKKGNMGYL